MNKKEKYFVKIIHFYSTIWYNITHNIVTFIVKLLGKTK